MVKLHTESHYIEVKSIKNLGMGANPMKKIKFPYFPRVVFTSDFLQGVF